jgi:hypothetical protein
MKAHTTAGFGRAARLPALLPRSLHRTAWLPPRSFQLLPRRVASSAQQLPPEGAASAQVPPRGAAGSSLHHRTEPATEKGVATVMRAPVCDQNINSPKQ